ncbi:MAG: PTS lactose/cellobiose transporter subunit IIA [Bulleidia sp.]
MSEDTEQSDRIAFQIISSAGTARSCFVEAMDLAEEGKICEAEEKIREGNEEFRKGHQIHAELLTKMAEGTLGEISLLLVHAEDQMMSAEDFGILAERLIRLEQKYPGKEPEE